MTVYRGGPSVETTGSQPAIRRRRTTLRWLLAFVLVVVLGNLLLVEAYASASFAPDSEHRPVSGGQVLAAVRDGGPLIDTTGRQPRSRDLPPRTIALTFDDGPDPLWTPQVLDVLARHRVPATFFVVGAQVARHPDLTQRLVAEGHELGAHTFTHAELAALPGWRRDLEYSQTQMAIAYAAGVTTSLLRPPYSSSPGALDDPNWTVVREAGARGYLTALNDTDSQDWARPGVDAIVRNSTPDGDSAVVLMHDAGGDRSQTVAALDRYIPSMKEKGFRFTTLSERRSANPPASLADRWRGGALVWSVRVADGTWQLLWLLLLVVGGLTLARTLLLFLFAVRHARRRRATTWPPRSTPASRWPGTT